MRVWYKREFNFLCCLQRALQLCVKLHHISPDDMKRGLQMLTSVTSPVVSKFTQIWWNFIFILSHWEKGDPDLNVVRCTADGQRRTEETRASHDMLFGLLDNILKHHMGGIFFNPVQFYLYRAASQQSTQGSQLCCRVNTLIIQGKPQKSEEAWWHWQRKIPF